MSLVRKLNPKHRSQSKDMRHMMRVFRMKYYTDPTDQFAQLYLAVHLALEALIKDTSRDGATKKRIYEQILDEYALNVAKFNEAVTATAPEAPA
jgi:hypothetical protein